jgi:hypothetical protein
MNRTDKLLELAALKNSGAITEEEFQKLKEELLTDSCQAPINSVEKAFSPIESELLILDNKSLYPGTPRITPEQYNMLKKGMSEADVERLLGGKGSKQSEYGSPGTRSHTKMYACDGTGSAYASMTYMIKEGQLISKSQIGIISHGDGYRSIIVKLGILVLVLAVASAFIIDSCENTAEKHRLKEAEKQKQALIEGCSRAKRCIESCNYLTPQQRRTGALINGPCMAHCAEKNNVPVNVLSSNWICLHNSHQKSQVEASGLQAKVRASDNDEAAEKRAEEKKKSDELEQEREEKIEEMKATARKAEKEERWNAALTEWNRVDDLVGGSHEVASKIAFVRLAQEHKEHIKQADEFLKDEKPGQAAEKFRVVIRGSKRLGKDTPYTKAAKEGLKTLQPVQRLANGVLVFATTENIPETLHWTRIKARPSSTRIYLQFGPGKRALAGKGVLVLAWPKGANRPKVRLEKKRYESYELQVPMSWIGRTKTVRLEWDDSM